jgi:hypothetical protein
MYCSGLRITADGATINRTGSIFDRDVRRLARTQYALGVCYAHGVGSFRRDPASTTTCARSTDALVAIRRGTACYDGRKPYSY